MKHPFLLSVLATFVAGTSPLFAQPGPGEAPIPDGPPADPVTPPSPVVPVALPPPAPPQSTVVAPEPEQNVSTGLALEIRLDTAQVQIASDAAIPGLAAGIFVGHRGRSLTIGVGFDVGRINQSQSAAGTTSESNATTVLVIPGVRFVLARTADAKTELLGQVDVGYGVTIRRAAVSGMDPPNVGRLRGQAGPSLRHWITPSFAIGATAGIRYDRSSLTSDNGGGMTSDSSFAITSLFSSLHMTGVF